MLPLQGPDGGSNFAFACKRATEEALEKLIPDA